MKNNLPEQGWFVKSDGSQKFKDTVCKYLNDEILMTHTLVGSRINDYYGVSENGKVKMETKRRHFGRNYRYLTLDEFIEMSKPIEPSITDAKEQCVADFETINVTDDPCAILMTGDAVCELLDELYSRMVCNDGNGNITVNYSDDILSDLKREKGLMQEVKPNYDYRPINFDNLGLDLGKTPNTISKYELEIDWSTFDGENVQGKYTELEEVKDFAKTGTLTNIKAGDGEIAHTREDKVDEMYTYFTKNCK